MRQWPMLCLAWYPLRGDNVIIRVYSRVREGAAGLPRGHPQGSSRAQNKKPSKRAIWAWGGELTLLTLLSRRRRTHERAPPTNPVTVPS